VVTEVSGWHEPDLTTSGAVRGASRSLCDSVQGRSYGEMPLAIALASRRVRGPEI
jgi:hypothetical protein